MAPLVGADRSGCAERLWRGSPSSWPTTASSSARGCGRCSKRDATSRWSASPRTTTASWPGPRRHPDVVVTDIRMPPNFQREGIDAGKEIRKRHPGTGVVILSQFDDPDYAVASAVGGLGRLRLPAEGPHRRGRSAGAGDPRGGHRRLDARPGDRRRTDEPGASDGRPHARGRALLALVAAGRPIKAIAMASNTTPGAVEGRVERLFVELADRRVGWRGGRARAPAPCCTRPSSSARSRARR